MHVLYWMCCLWGLLGATPTAGGIPNRWVVALAVGAFPITTIASLFVALRHPTWNSPRFYGLLPVLIATAAAPFAGSRGLTLTMGAMALVGAIAVGLTKWATPGRGESGSSFGVRNMWSRLCVFCSRAPAHISDVLVILLLPLIIDPALHFEQHSHNFFLGPVNALLAGKTMLVEVFSQYGVLSLYTLAGVFGSGQLPMSYPSFALLLSVLSVAQFGALYLLLRGAVRSEAVAGMGLLTIVTTIFFGQQGYAQEFPSTGLLRFGPVYLLLLITMLRYKRPDRQRVCLVLEALTIGISSIWSVETFGYVALTYAVMTAYEAIGAAATIGAVFRRLIGRFVLVVAAFTMAHAVLALAIRGQAGAWPDWPRYLDYVGLYLNNELSTLDLQAWSPWALIAAVYGFSLLALGLDLLARKRPVTWERVAVAGMSVFGVAQFSYFIGRAHPNNLFHVAIPAMFLCCVWVSRLAEGGATGVVGALRRPALYTAAAAVALTLLVQVPSVSRKLDATLLGVAVSGPAAIQPLLHLRERRATGPEVDDTLALIRRHAATQPKIAVLIDPEATTEVFVLSGRADVFHVGTATQEVLLPASSWLRLIPEPLGLQPGDVIFVGNSAELNALQQALFDRLCGSFNFTEIDRAPSGVAAVRLGAPAGGQVTCGWQGDRP